MSRNYTAKAEIIINAPVSLVWKALISPEMIKKYMFGYETDSEWKEGSTIKWSRKHRGNPYEDRGQIVKIENERLLQYAHYSAQSETPDTPEKNHTVTIFLKDKGDMTQLSVTQDNCESKETKKEAEEEWKTMLESMKILLEV